MINRLFNQLDNGRQRAIELPPNNPDAERAVLGSVILNSPEAIEAAGEIIAPSDFYNDLHQTIFALALELDRDGLPVDAVILAQRLPPKDAPPTSALFLGEIMEAPQSTANVRYYAGIVAECAKRRRLLSRAKTVQAALMNPAESWEEIQAHWLGEDDPAALFDACPPSEKPGVLGTFEPFPVDCLPKPLREFTTRAALRRLRSRLHRSADSLRLGRLRGHFPALRIKEEWIVPPVIWTCTIGESGTGKSPAMKMALRPLRTIQSRWFAQFGEDLSATPKTKSNSMRT